MTKIIFGFILGVFISGIAAKAVGIDFTALTARDIYSASALSAHINKGTSGDIYTRSFRDADEMMKRR